jgi:8-oxo-dGTP pyrophosphatase MutT (NUDIX family)
MHRQNILGQLRRYGDRYPGEHHTVERFIRFVEENPRCFERDCWTGHVTGSAWLVDPVEESLLLTHHKKLDMWLQLGGHSDGDADTQAVALREAMEESGLDVSLLAPDILDVDIHEIPVRKADPAHYHFDVRYSFKSLSRDFVLSEESMALAWVEIAGLEKFTTETSILRMRDKWLTGDGH